MVFGQEENIVLGLTEWSSDKNRSRIFDSLDILYFQVKASEERTFIISIAIGL